MTGIYKFYKNGELVYVQKNLITTYGQSLLRRWAAGQVSSWGEAIAVGTNNAAATVNDQNLGFEWYRTDVILKSVDNTNGNLILKGTIPAGYSGKIYEIGIYPALTNPQAGAFGTQILAVFDTASETWSNGTSNTTNVRIGDDSVQVTASASTTVTTNNSSYGYDLSGYSTLDKFSLAYFINDAYAASIKVRFKSDDTNYYEYTITPSTVTGYYITNWLKSAMTANGTPDWSSITEIELVVAAAAGGATTVQLDGLAAVDGDVYQDYGLVSHGILATPQTKALNEQLDIEYSVGLTAS